MNYPFYRKGQKSVFRVSADGITRVSLDSFSVVDKSHFSDEDELLTSQYEPATAEEFKAAVKRNVGLIMDALINVPVEQDAIFFGAGKEIEFSPTGSVILVPAGSPQNDDPIGVIQTPFFDLKNTGQYFLDSAGRLERTEDL